MNSTKIMWIEDVTIWYCLAIQNTKNDKMQIIQRKTPEECFEVYYEVKNICALIAHFPFIKKIIYSQKTDYSKINCVFKNKKIIDYYTTYDDIVLNTDLSIEYI